MRITVTIVIAILFLFCSCSSVSSEDAEPNATHKVGFVGPSRGVLYENVLRIVEASGGILITTEKMISEPLDQLEIVQYMIDAGCDGFIILPLTDVILPQIAEMCEEAHVYWATVMRPILDNDIKQIVESSPYYAGRVHENDEETAYEIVRRLGSEGKKKIALIVPYQSDTVGKARANGLYKAAYEYGIDVVAVVSNASTEEDVFQIMSDVIAAKPDLDAVFHVGSFVLNSTSAAIRAIEASGRSQQIQFASIDFGGITEEDFEKGIVIVAAGGHPVLDCVLSAGILINAINGTPVSPDGPLEVMIDYLVINSARDLREYNQANSENGGVLFSLDAARQLLLRKFNPALAQEDYNHIAAVYNQEYLGVLRRWNSG